MEQIGFCPIQIIVDDNIVKQDGLFDFVTRFGEAGLDDFLAVGAAPDKAFGKDFERRRQDEDAARFGQLLTHLRRTLHVNFQNHIVTLFAKGIDPCNAGSVIIAENVCVFEEGFLFD